MADDEDMEKLEWKRSFMASYIQPIRKEAAKETIILQWDPTSSGGKATFFQVGENNVVSLIGHVRKCEGGMIDRKQRRRIRMWPWRLMLRLRERVRFMKCTMFLKRIGVFVKFIFYS